MLLSDVKPHIVILSFTWQKISRPCGSTGSSWLSVLSKCSLFCLFFSWHKFSRSLKTFKNYYRGICLATWVLLWCYTLFLFPFWLWDGKSVPANTIAKESGKWEEENSWYPHSPTTCGELLATLQGLYWKETRRNCIKKKPMFLLIQGLENLLEECSGIAVSFLAMHPKIISHPFNIF